MPSNVVTLSGAVVHPADYPYHEDKRISDLLKLILRCVQSLQVKEQIEGRV